MAKPQPVATPPVNSGTQFNVPTNYKPPNYSVTSSLPTPGSPNYNPSGQINGIINGLQGAQNAANQANATRYNQGLGVVQQGANAAGKLGAQGQGFIQNAINNTSALGQTELTQNELQRQQGLGQTQQSAINRGLGNTTILDSLQGGVNRNANISAAAINEQTQQQKNALYQAAANQSNQQGNTAMQGGNAVSGFISAANQQAPDVSQYIPLVQQAAAASQVPKNRRVYGSTFDHPLGTNAQGFNSVGSGSPGDV